MSETEIIESGTVTFGVYGPGLVNIARELWVEGKALDATEILQNGVGLDREQALAVLEGRMTLENVDRSTLKLVEDDTTEIYGMSLGADEVIAKTVLALEESRKDLKDLVERRLNIDGPRGYYGQPIGPRDDLPEALEDWKEQRMARADSVLAELEEVSEMEASEMGVEVETSIHDMSPAALMLDPDTALKAYMDHQQKMAEMEFGPDPHFDYEEGWISPDGTYYGCLYMQHKALADWLDEKFYLQDEVEWGEDDFIDSDTALEKLGWVKIYQSALSGDRHMWVMPWKMEPTIDQRLTMSKYYDKFSKLTNSLKEEEWK